MIGVVVDATDRKRTEQERLELSGRLIQAGDAALSLFRIGQEALHNVVKHSGASKVTMRFDASSDFV